MVMIAMSSTPGWQSPTDSRPAGVIITHPNRDKPVVQATRATVIVLLLASAALVLIVTIGGWKVLQGAVPVQIAYVLVYLTLAFFAGRWNRGVLPVSAVLAVLLLIFALVAGPSWFARDKTGFEQPALNAGLLGLLTLLIVPAADAARRVRHARLLSRAGTSSSSAATPPPGRTCSRRRRRNRPERRGKYPPELAYTESSRAAVAER